MKVLFVSSIQQVPEREIERSENHRWFASLHEEEERKIRNDWLEKACIISSQKPSEERKKNGERADTSEGERKKERITMGWLCHT